MRLNVWLIPLTVCFLSHCVPAQESTPPTSKDPVKTPQSTPAATDASDDDDTTGTTPGTKKPDPKKPDPKPTDDPCQIDPKSDACCAVTTGCIKEPVTSAVLTGTVWAPGNAPGQVGAGFEIPVANALIYAADEAPAPVVEGAHCEACTALPPGAVRSDPKGVFSLTLKAGTFFLVIQKAQFRLVQAVTVADKDATALPAAKTTLPSRNAPAEGMFIPRMAVAEGLWDNLEDILGKMGIGAVDSGGTFVGASAVGHFDLYENGAGDFPEQSIATLQTLVTDLNVMKQYHIIFIPCSDGDNAALFDNPAVRQNLRDYVAAGGKLYVTDWSAEWMDVPFPAFVRFSAGHDTPATATTAAHFNDGDGTPAYSSHSANALDSKLNAWLNGQKERSSAGATVTINASAFEVEGLWNHVEELPSVTIGQTPNGDPNLEQAMTWVDGDWNSDGKRHPLTVSFEPGGCGRVLYSTYHTTENHHVGLVAQERVLLYLIMEIGECLRGPD